jgi:drug/metabolite transporter (DMT)-like permease
MLWLWITISFYFILAIVSLGDKYLMTAKIPRPEVYTFYIGISWTLVLILIPFVDFSVPAAKQIVISFLAGASYIFGIYWYNKVLYKFEASRVVPAVGAIAPIFTFFLVYFFSSEKAIPSVLGVVAFLISISGSLLISFERGKSVNFQSLKNSLVASFLFSLSFFLTKYIYLNQSFWNGFIWTKFGGIMAALLFFISYKGIREEVFKKRESFPRNTLALFVGNQSLGAASNILQNWAMAIAPLSYLAVIQALQGVQYVFLLIFTVFLTVRFPSVIKEEISRETIFQKVAAILLIGAGIALLVFQ